MKMNKFKRILSFVLAAVMTVTMLAACGQTVEDPEQSGTPAVTEPTDAPATSAPDVTQVPDNTVASGTTTAPVTTNPPATTTTPSTSNPATTTTASSAGFTVEEMSATMYATDAVNVRSGPSADYDRIGGLQRGDAAVVTGRASTGWYRIDLDGKVGYVSNAYLSSTRPDGATTTVTTGGSGDDDEVIIVDDDDIIIPSGTVDYGDWAEDNGWEYMLSLMNDQRYITVINQIAEGMQNLETEILVEPVITKDEAEDFAQLILPLIAVEYCYVNRVESVDVYPGSGILKSVNVSYYVNTKEEADAMVAQLRASTNSVLSQLGSSWSDYQKIKYLHDWLILKSVPDANSIGGPHATNAYGSIVEGRPTCLGYAKGMFYLLSKAGYDVTFGVGIGSAAKHIWVKVKIGSNWYNIDPTWDDPISPTADDPNLVYYDYFLVTDEFMERSHAEVYDMRFFDEPKANSLTYNWHYVNGYYATSMSEAEDIIRQATEDAVNGGGSYEYVRIKFSSSSLYQEFSSKYTRANYNSDILKDITSRYTCDNKYLGSSTWTLTYRLSRN